MPAQSVIAYLDLVPCGSPDGDAARAVARTCRGRFFDHTISLIRPKVIVAVGRYASEELYWYNTAPGRSGVQWPGLKTRHGTAEDAELLGHRCKLVFVTQPSARVSGERRDAASTAIAEAYRQMLSA